MADSYEPDRLPAPPADDGPMAQRVADADRDRTVTLLREHVVDGRITLDEFSDRIGLALQARTRGDLQEVMSNLPDLAVPVEETRRRKARRWFIGVMSGAGAKGRWRISGKTTAIAVMGGCDIDLRHAEIDGPEIIITAIAIMGGISIIVPEGFDVELNVIPFMGGRELKLRNVPLVPGSPRIIIKGFALMGGVDVRSKPSRTGKELGQTIVDHVLGAVGNMPSLSGGPGPIDLDALKKDIKNQIRATRRSAIQQGLTWTDAAEDPVPPPVPPPTATSKEEPPRQPSEGTVTILFIDMVGYSGMTEQLGDHISREILRELHSTVRRLLGEHGGREVKVQGDGFMVAFGSVARALRCAGDMQRSFTSYSQEHEERPIRVHVGVHTGEAMQEDDDFLGHTVVVASRLADAAQPGEVLVSALSAQMVERTEEFHFVNYRQESLKGLTRPQQVATLLWSD
ncbi:MAG TPA: adenylate/guanylate cyclase domain-containing protein [Acidimicrobiales bacterium]|jgi:class 3 adenylate cyclase